MKTKLKNVLLSQALIGLLFALGATSTQAQTQAENQVAKSTIKAVTPPSAIDPAPVFSEYRSIKIGMPVAEVRDSLERYLKAKGDQQDFLVLSDNETAQVFYENGKVTAISIDYLAKHDRVPTVMEVLGTGVEPRPDGSVYALTRYPAAGYWVSYNRTTGDRPIVTITMQAMR